MELDQLFSIINLDNKHQYQEYINLVETFFKENSINVAKYFLNEQEQAISKDDYIRLNMIQGFLLNQITRLNDENFISNCKKSIEYFYKVLNIDFENIDATKSITITCVEMSVYYDKCGDYLNSIKILESACFLDPANKIIYYNLGVSYFKSNNIEKALTNFKTSIKFCENDLEMISNCYKEMANVYISIKRIAEALYYIEKAESNCDSVSVQCVKSTILTEYRQTEKSRDVLNKLIQDKNNQNIYGKLYFNLGNIDSYDGDSYNAFENYNTSLKYNDFDKKITFQNKLYTSLHITDNLDFLYNEHLKVSRFYNFEKKYYNNATPEILNEILNKQQLKIGFVSGDFVEHPVSFFIIPLIKNLIKEKHQVFLFSQLIFDKAKIPDAEVIFIKNVNSNSIAKFINDNNIDILVDLSGHTSLNRLDIFTSRPCPIQITYLGYPYTTGLDCFDFFLSDDHCSKQDDEKYFSEKLLLSKCFLRYSHDPFDEMKTDVTIKKTCNREKLKIGCFNRINKITQGFINLVNDIMESVQNVEFVFKNKSFSNQKIMNNFNKRFKYPDRIKCLKCTDTHLEHLMSFNEIDLSLDTFPYSGTTTTCESLYMGVPVLTINGKSHCSNVSKSILMNSNLGEFVFDSKEDLINAFKNNKIPLYSRELVRNIFKHGKLYEKSTFLNLLKTITEIPNV